jgi:hypothetical protein
MKKPQVTVSLEVRDENLYVVKQLELEWDDIQL